MNIIRREVCRIYFFMFFTQIHRTRCCTNEKYVNFHASAWQQKTFRNQIFLLSKFFISIFILAFLEFHTHTIFTVFNVFCANIFLFYYIFKLFLLEDNFHIAWWIFFHFKFFMFSTFFCTQKKLIHQNLRNKTHLNRRIFQ